MDNKSNFKKGSVEMLILILLNGEEMYGYQISQAIFERSEGSINIPEGSLYPTLYKLLDNGYVTDEKKLIGKRMTRIYYRITPKGKQRLDTLYEDYIKVRNGIQQIIEKSTAGGSGNE